VKNIANSNIRHFCFGQWAVDIMPDDGARLQRLSYQRHELLTPPPDRFRPPRRDFGLYETRPVYGYDDCFPTVDPCHYPATKLWLPDHGELCWLKANCFAFDKGLKCVFVSRILPLVFEREMIFDKNSLTWIFTVINTGRKPLPFIHIMHPLMPVSKVRKVDLPSFFEIVDESTGRQLGPNKTRGVEKKLLSSPAGRAHMFLLHGVKEGFFRIHFCSGLNISVSYDSAIFPTLGIWWNRSGYPDEDGLARDECAFEPIPGASSSLKSAFKAGKCLCAPANGALVWRIDWQID
jgi:hypothetical protein